MLRTIAALSALSALALVLVVSLGGTDNDLLRLLGGNEPEPLVNANTGEAVTLESVQRDVEWHRETAKKLRELR